MAFDAFMMASVSLELDRIIGSGADGGYSKIEKIYMPDKDEIHFLLHTRSGSSRLVISASSNNPRVLISRSNKENPTVPPTFCMLLRKRLTGAKLISVKQLEFERVCEFTFDVADEMGFRSNKYIIAEIMGKYSNIIFLDNDRKILGALRTVDFSSSLKRQILVGMKYELPPFQEKLDPTKVTKEEFIEALDNFDKTKPCDKALLDSFIGMSSLVAREIVFRTTGDTTSLICSTDFTALYNNLSEVVRIIREGDFTPTLLLREDNSPFEYAFFDILQYGKSAVCEKKESISRLLDDFFAARDKNERIKQRSQDIFRLLQNAESRLIRKTEAQTKELADSLDMDKCKLYGDLIIQEMYKAKRGDRFIVATDYSKEPFEEVKIELDDRLTPSQNAQRYYKKYNRKKSAREYLTKEIEDSKSELQYIGTVFDALTRAENEKDLADIREELSEWGYVKRNVSTLKKNDKAQKPKPLHFVSPSGFDIYVGKNNIQNDYVTTKLSDKNDWWFHIKHFPGSHVLMKSGKICDDPPAEDFTFALELAATYSSAEGENIEVDYTQIRNIKKPPQSKPGYVTYSVYYSATVSPNREEIKKKAIK